MAKAGKSSGPRSKDQKGAKRAGRTKSKVSAEASETTHGNGSLQADGKGSVPNGHTGAGTRDEADSLIESFEKLSKKSRAQRDPGKKALDGETAPATDPVLENMRHEQEIRARAYEIWEREGRPNGKQTDHWLQAQQELGGSA